jgi:CheY-like chemotaxis protein
MSAPVNKSLLVADDEEGIRDLYAFTLEPLGYRVTAVEDRASLLELCRRRAFDLVIVDVHMPGLAGANVVKALLEIRREQRVLVVTGQAERSFDELQEQAREAGALACLMKPVDLDEFINSVSLSLTALPPLATPLPMFPQVLTHD